MGKSQNYTYLVIIVNTLQRSSRRPLTCKYRVSSELLNLEINWLEKLMYEGQGQGHNFFYLQNEEKRNFSLI